MDQIPPLYVFDLGMQSTTFTPTTPPNNQLSALVIFFIALGAFIALLLLIGLMVMIYMLCRYGTLCPSAEQCGPCCRCYPMSPMCEPCCRCYPMSPMCCNCVPPSSGEVIEVVSKKPSIMGSMRSPSMIGSVRSSRGYVGRAPRLNQSSFVVRPRSLRSGTVRSMRSRRPSLVMVEDTLPRRSSVRRVVRPQILVSERFSEPRISRRASFSSCNRGNGNMIALPASSQSDVRCFARNEPVRMSGCFQNDASEDIRVIVRNHPYPQQRQTIIEASADMPDCGCGNSQNYDSGMSFGGNGGAELDAGNSYGYVGRGNSQNYDSGMSFSGNGGAELDAGNSYSYAGRGNSQNYDTGMSFGGKGGAELDAGYSYGYTGQHSATMDVNIDLAPEYTSDVGFEPQSIYPSLNQTNFY